MHFLLFGLLDHTKAKTSMEARRVMYDKLTQAGLGLSTDDDPLSSKADWFVIGGRWSGIFNPVVEPFEKEAARRLVELGVRLTASGFFDKDLSTHQKVLQHIWETHGGKDVNPYNRNHYNRLGYEDDAVILTSYWIDKLRLKAQEDVYEVSFDYQLRCFNTATNQLISLTDCLEDADTYRDTHWIVVVDYHD
ncbi:MAG: hypothetical protein GC181_10655 [Bacteroidetes bacterium]|nr:hypothetical protein [Bacteroidota bacterium]